MMMEDKNQKTIQELDKFIKKLKNMNIVKAKEVITSHINISYSIYIVFLKDKEITIIYKFTNLKVNV